jgi:hypothetical protein
MQNVTYFLPVPDIHCGYEGLRIQADKTGIITHGNKQSKPHNSQ